MDDAKYQQRKLIADQVFETRSDDRSKLRKLGMKPVAELAFGDGRITLDFLDGWYDKSPGVYAFAAANRVVRVGSSGKGVPVRLRQYPRHINNSVSNMEGKSPELKTPTPQWEAALWQYVYETLAQGKGQVWSRPSHETECALGPVPARFACKLEEAIVAERFIAPGLRQPVLNRSSRIT